MTANVIQVQQAQLVPAVDPQLASEPGTTADTRAQARATETEQLAQPGAARTAPAAARPPPPPTS